MKDIIGIEFNYPFDNLIKIADLIYFDGPLLSHFINNNGDNFLFYWVDVNEKHNRWILVRIDLYSLQEYVKRKKTLFEVITKPNDGFLYIVDVGDDLKFENCKMVLPSNLSSEYLPEKDSFYEFEPKDDIDLFSLSKKMDSGLLELHLEGGGIHYGSIPFDKLSVFLPKIEDIRKSLAAKYIRNYKNDYKNKLPKDLYISLYNETSYEYIYSLAGSFRVILRPLHTQLQIPDSESFADDFAKEFITLVESGNNKESIHLFSEKYNKDIIKKYSNFVNYISDQKMDFGIKWYNYNSKISREKSISVKDIESIINNLSEFEYDDKKYFEVIGKFYSINTHTGGYSFEPENSEDIKSIGKFDKKLIDRIKFVSFAENYFVRIKREIKEQVGAKQKKKDTIIAFEKVKNQRYD
jgi:hypothetical protein